MTTNREAFIFISEHLYDDCIIIIVSNDIVNNIQLSLAIRWRV